MCILTIIALLGSCSPLSKEQYLDQYKAFVDDVTERGPHFSDAEWQRANAEFARFSNELYAEYKHQLTFEEALRVAGYKLQFNATRAGVEMNKFYHSYLKDDIDSLKVSLKYYVENKMDDDIAQLLEEAKRISDELYREVKKLLAELNEEAK